MRDAMPGWPAAHGSNVPDGIADAQRTGIGEPVSMQ
jgi:hypothetical protein